MVTKLRITYSELLLHRSSIFTTAQEDAPRTVIILQHTISKNSLPMPKFTHGDMATDLIHNLSY